jgi:alkyl hydroperoxide reductase subunit AhpC
MHFFCVQDIKYKQNKVKELPAQGRKVLGIKSPDSKWVQLRWASIAREANNTKGA